MSTIEKLRKDKMLAMKNKDKVKSGVISLIMINILLEQKEKKRDLWYVPSLLDKPVRRVFLCDIVMNLKKNA